MNRVRIERIAAGGDGVGRLSDGLTVFVPRTAPGDLVDMDVLDRRSRWARGPIVELLEPSSDRVEPPCRHFVVDGCGGCQLQHIVYSAQLRIKTRIVGDALRRIGKRHVPDPQIVSSDEEWRYRARITFSRAASGGPLGLRRYDNPDATFSPEDCLLTNRRIAALWRALRPAVDGLPNSVKSIELAEDPEKRLHVTIFATHPWDSAPLIAMSKDHDVCIWERNPTGHANPVAGDGCHRPPEFQQPNEQLAGRIRDQAVAGIVAGGGPALLVGWDLYGGVGDTARRLARHFDHVWSVDSDPTAHAWAKIRSSDPPRGQIHYHTGPVERFLTTGELPSAVIVNPPRRGLDAPVAVWLNDWAARQSGARVAYISCDPATLARDIARMPGLAIESVLAFDLFPQTSHVETLVVLAARS